MATGIPPSKQAKSLMHGGTVSLAYEGKKSKGEILKMLPAKVVELVHSNVKPKLGNRLYYGDNLSIMAMLARDTSVHGKVKLIYIDPPYATRSIFKSRSQIDAYSDLLNGAQYLEFLRERLFFMWELLANDGSIYIHLDDNMAFHVKVLMDEIFGQKNFRNWITRKKCNPKNYTHKTFGNISDYILFYTKSDAYFWCRPMQPWTQEKAFKEYAYIEKGTGRRFKKVPVHAPGKRNGETGTPWKGKLPPVGKHWQYPPTTLDAMDLRGEIYWSPTGNPRRKIYLDESKGLPLQDIWLDVRDAHNQNIHITGYPTEKNPVIIQRIIEASSAENDIVLDCFAGSGTTLDVSSRLKRRWIGIDNSIEAIKAILMRFKTGLKPMSNFLQSGSANKNMTPLMFDLAPDTKQESEHHSIHDFDIYATTPHNEDLASILNEWKE